MTLRGADETGDAEIDVLYAEMQRACEGYSSGAVMYAICMMIAHGIQNSANKPGIDFTMDLLRQTIEFEMAAHNGEYARPAGKES